MLARQLYFWPSMSQDVKVMIERCGECFSLLPRQQQLPLQETLGKFPLEHTSSDLFQYGGKYYLVYADRYSGMVWCDRLSSLNTQAVTDKLLSWMLDFGFPHHLRTDGGPQFRSDFDSWCQEHGIIHELSSPYHPQSNGHAERAVKTAKHLMIKVEANLKQFKIHLSAWRNTPTSSGTVSYTHLTLPTIPLV